MWPRILWQGLWAILAFRPSSWISGRKDTWSSKASCVCTRLPMPAPKQFYRFPFHRRSEACLAFLFQTLLLRAEIWTLEILSSGFWSCTRTWEATCPSSLPGILLLVHQKAFPVLEYSRGILPSFRWERFPSHSLFSGDIKTLIHAVNTTVLFRWIHFPRTLVFWSLGFPVEASCTLRTTRRPELRPPCIFDSVYRLWKALFSLLAKPLHNISWGTCRCRQDLKIKHLLMHWECLPWVRYSV